MHTKALVDSLGECLDGRIAGYIPDAVVETTKEGSTVVVVIRFTGSLAEGVPDHDFRVATKTQAYSSTLRHLRRLRGPGVEVRQQMFVMSCHGVVDER